MRQGLSSYLSYRLACTYAFFSLLDILLNMFHLWICDELLYIVYGYLMNYVVYGCEFSFKFSGFKFPAVESYFLKKSDFKLIYEALVD
jgi:hypothetical protein